MATIKQFGLAGIGSDVQLGKNGGRLVYNSGSGRFDFFASDGATLEKLRASGLQLGATTAVVSISNDLDTANLWATASNTDIATSLSTKTYLNFITNNGALLVSGDSGSGSIILRNETLSINGNANTIVTAFEGTNTVRVDLVNSPLIAGDLTVKGNITTLNGTLQGNILADTLTFTGSNTIALTGVIDDDTLLTASNTTLATSESIKAYVDNELTGSGLAMNVAGDTGNGSIIFSSETYNIFGTANQITSTFDSVSTLTLSLPNNLVAPANLTVSNTFFTGQPATRIPYITTGGALTSDATLTFNDGTNTLFAQTIDVFTLEFNSLSGLGSISVTNILDEDDMVSNLANALVTQQSVKAYVDAEVDKYSVLTINADGPTEGNVDLFAQELTISGTGNEITTFISNQTVQIGLANDVVIPNNLTVTGNLFSNDIEAAFIAIRGNATVSGDLTVLGNTTTVNSIEVDIADSVIRVNSDGAVANAGLEVNNAGTIESVVYVPGTNQWTFSNTIFADVEFTSLSGTGSVVVVDIIDDDTMNTALANNIATSESIKAYIDTEITAIQTAAVFDVVGDVGRGNIDVYADEFRVLGGVNINTVAATDPGTGNVLQINLDDSVTTGNVTVTGQLQFNNFYDGNTTVNTIVSEANGIINYDNDTSFPTTAAIIDYVANNAGDGLLIRGAFTADGANSNVSLGLVPNVLTRTYYPNKVVVTIGTAFSGNSVNQIVIKDNNGTGTTLAAAQDTDIATTGTYVIEQDGLNALVKNTNVQLYFYQSNGSTEAAPTAGDVTVAVYYNWL